MRMAARCFITVQRRSSAPSTRPAANSTASSVTPSADHSSYPQIPRTRLKIWLYRRLLLSPWVPNLGSLPGDREVFGVGHRAYDTALDAPSGRDLCNSIVMDVRCWKHAAVTFVLCARRTRTLLAYCSNRRHALPT